jgi:hypothetical protein
MAANGSILARTYYSYAKIGVLLGGDKPAAMGLGLHGRVPVRIPLMIYE